MHITTDEANQIVAFIHPVYAAHLAKYDFGKYPAADYLRFKASYSGRTNPNNEINASLVWKWGHAGKSNFPSSQKALIRSIEMLWPTFVHSNAGVASPDTFTWWKVALPSTSYITAAYITHLVHHREPLPIIDQHNFRAMNQLLARVRTTHTIKKKPSVWQDILNLKVFMMELLKHMPGMSFEELDRFLMMYGRSIKQRKPRKGKP